MGYFDALTDACFKTDDEGRIFFYRCGIFGKGYILPDEAKKQQIRRFVKLYYMVSLPAIIATGIIVGWVYSFFSIPLFFLWYFFATARLLKGLAVTGERLALQESYSSSAKSHNFVTLWIMLIFSIFFVLAGFALVLYAHDAWLIWLASIIFFGAIAIVIGYMIKIKRRENGVYNRKIGE